MLSSRVIDIQEMLWSEMAHRNQVLFGRRLGSGGVVAAWVLAALGKAEGLFFLWLLSLLPVVMFQDVLVSNFKWFVVSNLSCGVSIVNLSIAVAFA